MRGERLSGTVRFDTREVQDGVPVAFSGFPLEYVFPITSKGNIGGKLALEKSDTIFDYVIDKSAWPGVSGSPVYLADGKVIGIIRAGGINAGSGLAYARTAVAIVDLISKHPADISKKKP